MTNLLYYILYLHVNYYLFSCNRYNIVQSTSGTIHFGVSLPFISISCWVGRHYLLSIMNGTSYVAAVGPTNLFLGN